MFNLIALALAAQQPDVAHEASKAANACAHSDPSCVGISVEAPPFQPAECAARGMESDPRCAALAPILHLRRPEPTTLTEIAAQRLYDRTEAERVYRTCLLRQSSELAAIHLIEPAETIVRAAQYYCRVEWGDLDLKIHLEAIYSGIDADRITLVWQADYHNEALVKVLESRTNIPKRL